VDTPKLVYRAFTLFAVLFITAFASVPNPARAREVFLVAYPLYQAGQSTPPYLRLYEDPNLAWLDYSSFINSPSFTGDFTVAGFEWRPAGIYRNYRPASYGWRNYSKYPVWYYGYAPPTPSGNVTIVTFCPGAAPYESAAILTAPGYQLVRCVLKVYDREADPAPDCRTCAPVQITTGEKYLRELDYSGGFGLEFVRTYRAVNRKFTSILDTELQDNTLPNKKFKQCYNLQFASTIYVAPTYYAFNSYCFEVISNGAAEYRLRKADGYTTLFTGSSSNPNRPANINEAAAKVVNSQGNTEWRVKRDDDAIETYTAEGMLTSRTTRAGATTVFENSTPTTPTEIAPKADLLLSQTNPFGQRIRWRYDAAARLVKMIDPAGGEYDYTYGPNGTLASVTFPPDQFEVRRTKAYHYEDTRDLSRLTGVTDENGWRFATYTYNIDGRVSQTKWHAYAGQEVNQTSFAYATGSTGVTDPLGTLRTYNYGNVLTYDRTTGISQPCAPVGCTGTQTEQRGYDANGNLTSVIDRNGVLTCYAFDLVRNLETARIEGLPGSANCATALIASSLAVPARKRTTTWHPTFRLPATITEPVAGGTKVTTNSYDTVGNISQRQVVTADGTRTWSWTYDAYGRLLTATDPLGRISTNTYYPNTEAQNASIANSRGMLASATNAQGHTTSITAYNPHGQPLVIADANGLTTTLAYDARQRLISRSQSAELTSYEYDGVGQLKKLTLPDGSVLNYTYDGAHRLVQIADGIGNRLVYTLDPAGNRLKEDAVDPQNALARTRSRVFDSLSRLKNDIGGLGATQTSTYSYDGNGNLVTGADPLNRSTTNGYDALNRLIQVNDPLNGAAAPTKYEYDAQDNLTKVTDPKNLATTYTYNGFNELVSQVSPDTGTTTFSYDAAGNMLTKTDARGVTVTYAYDALNRVTAINYPAVGPVSAQTVTYSYDACPNGKGRLCSFTDRTGTTTYTYDIQGRVRGKAQMVNGITQTVGYRYNALGQMDEMTLPSGRKLSVNYLNNRVTRIAVNGIPIVKYADYEPFGPIGEWTWGNDAVNRPNKHMRYFDLDGRNT
jgi:YD repeat-containing protein